MIADSKVANGMFAYNQPKLGWHQNIASILAGTVDSRGVFRQFLKDNNIDRGSIDVLVVTRDKYMLRTHYIEYLADRRDRVARHYIAACRAAQKASNDKLENLKVVIAKEKDILTVLRGQLKDKRLELKDTSLSLQQRAHYQGDLGTLDASIKNQIEKIASLGEEQQRCEETLKDNLKQFDKCRKELNGVYQETLNMYTRRAGRPMHAIGYTHYDAELRDYDMDVSKEIKDLRHGQ